MLSAKVSPPFFKEGWPDAEIVGLTGIYIVWPGWFVNSEKKVLF